jgi:hypothetical protein
MEHPRDDDDMGTIPTPYKLSEEQCLIINREVQEQLPQVLGGNLLFGLVLAAGIKWPSLSVKKMEPRLLVIVGCCCWRLALSTYTARLIIWIEKSLATKTRARAQIIK